VVTPGSANTINWTYVSTNPANWRIESSSDGGVTWSEVDLVVGTDRTYTGLSTGDLARVIGVDGFDVPTLEPSNAVIVP